jgi:hypothetical protein
MDKYYLNYIKYKNKYIKKKEAFINKFIKNSNLNSIKNYNNEMYDIKLLKNIFKNTKYKKISDNDLIKLSKNLYIFNKKINKTIYDVLNNSNNIEGIYDIDKKILKKKILLHGGAKLMKAFSAVNKFSNAANKVGDAADKASAAVDTANIAMQQGQQVMQQGQQVMQQGQQAIQQGQQAMQQGIQQGQQVFNQGIENPIMQNEYMAPIMQNEYMAPITQNEYMAPITQQQYIPPPVPEMGTLDWIQLILDICGMVPGVGAPLDLLSMCIALMRGDMMDACLSYINIIPIVGSCIGTPIKMYNKWDMILAGLR